MKVAYRRTPAPPFFCFLSGRFLFPVTLEKLDLARVRADYICKLRDIMRGFAGLLILAALFLILSFRQGIDLYVDWLWFQEVGYTQLFTTNLLYKFILAILSGGLLSALLYFNLRI